MKLTRDAARNSFVIEEMALPYVNIYGDRSEFVFVAPIHILCLPQTDGSHRIFFRELDWTSGKIPGAICENPIEDEVSEVLGEELSSLYEKAGEGVLSEEEKHRWLLALGIIDYPYLTSLMTRPTYEEGTIVGISDGGLTFRFDSVEETEFVSYGKIAGAACDCGLQVGWRIGAMVTRRGRDMGIFEMSDAHRILDCHL